MYEAFREAPQSKKDRSRLKLGLWITLAAVLLALTATPLCVGVPAERGIPPVYGRSERQRAVCPGT